MDSGSLVDFAPTAPGSRNSQLYFQRIFWGQGDDLENNKCKTYITVAVVRREIKP